MFCPISTRAVNVKRKIPSPHPDEEGAVIHRHSEGGPLHDLLLKACPQHPISGVKSITVLSDFLGINAWSIHKWVKNGKIPAKRAKQIVDLADDRVTLAEFDPFVYV
jgi:hypothetical protein